MRLKTQALVDANSRAVVSKDIQDNTGEMLCEQCCHQRFGNSCRVSLSTSFWGGQNVAQDRNPMRCAERVCSTSGHGPLSFIGTQVHPLCEKISREVALRVLLIQVAQGGQI